MEDGFSGIGPEMDLHRMRASQALRHQGNALGGQEFADEGGVQLADGRRLQAGDDIAAAEDLGDQPAAIPTLLHHGVDEQLHGMHAAARGLVVIACAGQQDMIHAPGPGHRIAQTDGHAGAEQGLQERTTLPPTPLTPQPLPKLTEPPRSQAVPGPTASVQPRG